MNEHNAVIVAAILAKTMPVVMRLVLSSPVSGSPTSFAVSVTVSFFTSAFELVVGSLDFSVTGVTVDLEEVTSF